MSASETAVCPCCRQALPPTTDLLIDEEAGALARGGRITFLTPQEWAVFCTLRSVSPRVCTKQKLLSDLYWQYAEEEEPDQKIFDVYVCKLRKKVAPLGIVIDTVWGRGWRLVSMGEPS